MVSRSRSFRSTAPSGRKSPWLPTYPALRTTSCGNSYCTPKLKLYVVGVRCERSIVLSEFPRLFPRPVGAISSGTTPLGNGLLSELIIVVLPCPPHTPTVLQS